MQLPACSHIFRFRSLCALHFQKLSNRYRHKYDVSILRIFQSNFWRVFAVRPNCVARAEVVYCTALAGCTEEVEACLDSCGNS